MSSPRTARWHVRFGGQRTASLPGPPIILHLPRPSFGKEQRDWLGLAYGHIAVITLMGLFILRKLDRIER
jgi:hypothetical protein